MKPILIADAGSTKIDWIVADASGKSGTPLQTTGLNALLAEEPATTALLGYAKSKLGVTDSLSHIYYYGAGCATPRVCSRMKELLGNVFQADEIEVNSDLLGAGRALFGDRSGIACILGTGSNSGFYDGHEIKDHIPALGYILGDEGSGAALGKRLVGDLFKRQMPETVLEAFFTSQKIDLDTLLDKVYRSPDPNTFLASLVPFIANNLWNPYVYSVVLQEFKRFLKRNVAMYEGARQNPVGFVGMVASVFRRILDEAATSQGLRIGKILDSPIEELVKYHISHMN